MVTFAREWPLMEWPTFVSGLAEWREARGRQYRSRSFSRRPVEQVDEIAEELLDVVGWAFILWARVREIRERVEAP